MQPWGWPYEKLCLFVCCSSAESPKCGNNNESLDKAAAVVILGELLKGV